MKRSPVFALILIAGLAAGSLLYTATPAYAAAEKTMTVKGEIVDLACYLDHGAKGEKHKACALTCLKNGEPMGLLTSEGTVYLLLAPHDDQKAFEEAKGYAAEQVEVTGPPAERAGIKGLVVQAVHKV
jgi:hypothetical protein